MSKSLVDGDIDVMKYVMTRIREDPRLARRYVEIMEQVQEDKAYKFSQIEKEMFIAMKLLFDEAYDRLLKDGASENAENYTKLVRIVKDLYECLGRSLLNVKSSEGDMSRLKGLTKMIIETDSSISTYEKKGTEEVFDVE